MPDGIRLDRPGQHHSSVPRVAGESGSDSCVGSDGGPTDIARRYPACASRRNGSCSRRCDTTGSRGLLRSRVTGIDLDRTRRRASTASRRFGPCGRSRPVRVFEPDPESRAGWNRLSAHQLSPSSGGKSSVVSAGDTQCLSVTVDRFPDRRPLREGVKSCFEFGMRCPLGEFDVFGDRCVEP